MTDQGCSSLTQYLATLVTQDFSPKFSEEWIKHTATLKGVPTVADLMSFTEPLEYAGSSISESQPVDHGAKKPEKNSSQPRNHPPASSSSSANNSRKCSSSIVPVPSLPGIRRFQTYILRPREERLHELLEHVSSISSVSINFHL